MPPLWQHQHTTTDAAPAYKLLQLLLQCFSAYMGVSHLLRRDGLLRNHGWNEITSSQSTRRPISLFLACESVPNLPEQIHILQVRERYRSGTDASWHVHSYFYLFLVLRLLLFSWLLLFVPRCSYCVMLLLLFRFEVSMASESCWFRTCKPRITKHPCTTAGMT